MGTTTKASATERDAWVDGILRGMTLEEKVGQCFMGNFCGVDSAAHVRELVRRHRFGGLQLSLVFQTFVRGGNYKPCKVARWRPAIEIARWLHEIGRATYEETGVPSFIGIDREAGAGILRSCRISEFPTCMGFAAAGDPALHYRAARIDARETKAIGANMIYGPVMDLATNPANPEVGIRPYSNDPEVAGRFAAEYIRACREEGVVCTPKHFPGRGRGCSDAHLELETVDTPREEYERTDLRSFELAIAAGAPGIMVAHTHYTAYQPDRRPGTLSREIITDLLRGQLGFQGLIIPDTMTMFAVSKNYEVPEAVVMALEAGIDQLFMKVENLYRPCFDAILAAIRSGRLTEEQMDAKARRVLVAKWDAGLTAPVEFDADRVAAILADPESKAVAREVARRSAVLVKRGSSVPLRLEEGENLLVVDQRTLGAILHNDPERRHDEVYRLIRQRHANSTFLLVDTTPTEDQIYEAEALLHNAARIVIVLRGRNPALAELFCRLRDLDKVPGGGKVPIIVLNFGVPYILGNEIQGMDAAIQHFDCTDTTAEAAVELLFSGTSDGGTLPVDASQAYPKGHGL